MTAPLRKWCPGCRAFLPPTREHFNGHGDTTDGLRGVCRRCDALRMKRRRMRVGYPEVRPERVQQSAEARRSYEERAEMTPMFLDRLGARGVNLVDVARLVGADKNTVWRWRGWGCVPRPKLFGRLAKLALEEGGR